MTTTDEKLATSLEIPEDYPEDLVEFPTEEEMDRAYQFYLASQRLANAMVEREIEDWLDFEFSQDVPSPEARRFVERARIMESL